MYSGTGMTLWLIFNSLFSVRRDTTGTVPHASFSLTSSFAAEHPQTAVAT